MGVKYMTNDILKFFRDYEENKILKEKNYEKYADVDISFMSKVLISIFPIDYMVKEAVVPIKIDHDFIYIGTYRQLNDKTIKDIEKSTNLQVKQEYILYSQYCNYIRQYKINICDKFKGSDINLVIINNLFSDAINYKSSDVHFETDDSICTIRFRVDGVIIKYNYLPLKVYDKILSILKLQSNMDISKKLIPQDGNMNLVCEKKTYNLRTSTIPSIYREKMVVRILNPKSDVNLYELGFDEEYKEFETLAYKSNGIFLVSGPTGSGKSTTLKAIINIMNKGEKNIITIEDPVEYKINGITQVSLNEKVDLGFKEALKSILRQDPDVIMIGEIRDEQTAQIALRAAITGHLVLSTIHTYDSTSVITRLLDMNITKYILLDGLSLVLSQRLVRRICPYCKRSYIVEEDTCVDLDINIGSTLYKGEGCSKCKFTGYLGRVIVYEMLHIKDIHRKYISENKDLTGFREFCIDNGLSTLKDKCIKYLKSGVTTLEEVYKVII